LSSLLPPEMYHDVLICFGEDETDIAVSLAATRPGFHHSATSSSSQPPCLAANRGLFVFNVNRRDYTVLIGRKFGDRTGQLSMPYMSLASWEARQPMMLTFFTAN
uniref:DUF3700 domain-containing protein n=1 Tax=Rodentolepis nana TaxID=102285 RepID=A0A0R3T9W2_RODNA